MLRQGTYGYHKVNENRWTPFLHHTGEFYDAERNVTMVVCEWRTYVLVSLKNLQGNVKSLSHFYIFIVLIA